MSATYCMACHYYAPRKADYQKHLNTEKHKKRQRDYEQGIKINCCEQCCIRFTYETQYLNHCRDFHSRS